MGMKQYVNKPTKITKGGRPIIGLIFSNKEIEASVMHEMYDNGSRMFKN